MMAIIQIITVVDSLAVVVLNLPKMNQKKAMITMNTAVMKILCNSMYRTAKNEELKESDLNPIFCRVS